MKPWTRIVSHQATIISPHQCERGPDPVRFLGRTQKSPVPSLENMVYLFEKVPPKLTRVASALANPTWSCLFSSRAAAKQQHRTLCVWSSVHSVRDMRQQAHIEPQELKSSTY